MVNNGYIDGVSVADAVRDLLLQHSMEENRLINKLRGSGIAHNNECYKGDLWVYGYDVYSPEFVDSDEHGEYVTLWGTFKRGSLDLMKSKLLSDGVLVYRGSGERLFIIEGK